MSSQPRVPDLSSLKIDDRSRKTGASGSRGRWITARRGELAGPLEDSCWEGLG